MKTTLKRVLAFLFAFAMVVALLPASILAEDNGEAPVVDETVEVPAGETPSTDIPEATPDTEYTGGGYTEAPAEEAPVEEQKVIVMNPVETPSAGGTIEIPGDGSVVLIGENPVGTEAPATSEEPAESEEPATGNRIYFKGNGGKLRSYANSDWGTPDYYVAGTEINIATVLDGKTFVHDLSKDYSTAYRFTGWNTSADGNGTAYANSDSFIMPDGPVTLYAQWEAYEWIY